MNGNVWERCLTEYKDPQLDPSKVNMSSKNSRVMRGGSFDVAYTNLRAPSLFMVERRISQEAKQLVGEMRKELGEYFRCIKVEASPDDQHHRLLTLADRFVPLWAMFPTF